MFRYFLIRYLPKYLLEKNIKNHVKYTVNPGVKSEVHDPNRENS